MEFLTYLLKVSVCLTLFFCIYITVLKRLTFFSWNRFYLLATMMMSFGIPAMQFSIEREVIETQVEDNQYATPFQANQELAEIGTSQVGAVPVLVESNIDWVIYFYVVYALICSILLAVSIWKIFQLFSAVNYKVKTENGLKIVAKTHGFTNCSFFNYVFVDERNLKPTEFEILLKHEQVHAKQLHSIDKLLLMLAKAILWFNPLVYLYDKALEELHEFEADEETSLSFGTSNYAGLLLKLAVGESNMPVVHHFVKSPIKQRIKMLFNSKSKQMKKLMYLFALPALLGLLWGFTVDRIDVLPKSTKEKEFVLILDAGHGGKQKGVEVNGFAEKDITLMMAKKIQALAEARGIKVVATRKNDETTSHQDRVKTEGTILISLHINSAPEKLKDKMNGIALFIAKGEKNPDKVNQSTAISSYLHKSFKQLKGINVQEQVQQRSLLLLNESPLPTVLLELGYLTNANDFKFITNDSKQDELANRIVEAIIAYQKGNVGGQMDGKSNLKGAKKTMVSPIPNIASAKVNNPLTDTLRLVGGRVLGKNPKVTIDGKAYDASILTKISPKSIKATFIIPDSISILTVNKRVELASAIEISNFKTKLAVGTDQLYTRYTLRKDDGERYEVLKLNLNNGSAAFDVAYGWKVMLVINGKEFSEKQAESIRGDLLKKYDTASSYEKNDKLFADKYPQYIGKYDAIIEVHTGEKFVKHDLQGSFNNH